MSIDVLLSGASGCNFGDDRIAFELAKYHLLYGKSVCVNSLNVERSLANFTIAGLSAESVKHIDAFWPHHIPPNQLNSFSAAIKEGMRFFDADFDKGTNLPMDFLEGTKWFHLHGGGYLNSMWPHGAFQIGVALAMKQKFGTRLVATGLGCMPLNGGDRVALAEVISSFEVFEFRDKASLEALSAYGAIVQKGVDDIFIAEQGSISLASGAPNLHLCLQVAQWDEAVSLSCMIKIERFLTKFGDDIDKIIIHEFCPPGDLQLLEWPIFSKMQDRLVIRDFEQTMREGPLACAGDLAIVSRFHAHLLFCRQGVRGLYSSQSGLQFVSEFYDVKHSSLLEIGSNWCSFDKLDEIDMGSFGPVPDWRLFNDSNEAKKRVSLEKFFNSFS